VELLEFLIKSSMFLLFLCGPHYLLSLCLHSWLDRGHVTHLKPYGICPSRKIYKWVGSCQWSYCCETNSHRIRCLKQKHWWCHSSCGSLNQATMEALAGRGRICSQAPWAVTDRRQLLVGCWIKIISSLPALGRRPPLGPYYMCLFTQYCHDL
jgi:hypothetical protein